MIHSSRHIARSNGYAQTKVRTAGPAERVVLMYSAIVKHLTLALQAFELPSTAGNELIHDHLSTAEQLIAELRLAIDHRIEGDLPKTLDSLYTYWERELGEANVRKEAERVRGVLDMIDSLREAWQKASTEMGNS